MKYRKPLLAAAVAASLIVGGAGIAAAGEGSSRDNRATETASVQQANFETRNADGNGEGRSKGSGDRLDAVAEVLDMDVEDLRSQLEDGSTLAEVAEANGVASDELVSALVADVEEKLDAKVEAGDMTAEEAAAKLESKTESITNKINGVEDDRDGNDNRGDDDEQDENETAS